MCSDSYNSLHCESLAESAKMFSDSPVYIENQFMDWKVWLMVCESISGAASVSVLLSKDLIKDWYVTELRKFSKIKNIMILKSKSQSSKKLLKRNTYYSCIILCPYVQEILWRN